MKKMDESAFAFIVVCTGKGSHAKVQLRQFKRYWTGAGHIFAEKVMVNAAGASEAVKVNSHGEEFYELNCRRCNRQGGARWSEATVRQMLDNFATAPGVLEWDLSTAARVR